MVLFSTTSNKDFSDVASEHYRIEPVSDYLRAFEAVLAHPHKWWMPCRCGGCSCHFRHAFGGEFGPVEEWMTVDPDDVESTEYAYDSFVELWDEGEEVDVVVTWSDSTVEDIRTQKLDVKRLPRDHFLFIENMRLELV